MSKTTYYSLTVKCNDKSKHPLVGDYQEWIYNAEDKGVDILSPFYEVDSKDRLHLHAVLLGPKNLYKKKLMYKGYHQKIDEIPSWGDLIAWSDYIQKGYYNNDQYNQFLLEYEIRHGGYMFVDKEVVFKEEGL